MPRRDWPSSDERLTAIHQQLVDAVESLVTSEAWTTVLKVAARFPDYSPSNLLLIATQRPDATRVAGIRTWNSLGRRVNKGEHGIAILAPCLYKQAAADQDPASASVTGTADDAEPGAQHVLRGFKVVHVFDITQTDGDPLPDQQPALLTGDAPTHLWDHLADLVHDDGYTLERGPCPSGVLGYTALTSKHVRVRDDVEPAQAVKTLAHELGHIRADHATRFADYGTDPVCRSQAELEAESIAYIVMTHHGLDSAIYSVPYLAAWSDGDAGRLRECITKVVSVARGMLPPAPDAAASRTASRGLEARELAPPRHDVASPGSDR